MMNEDINTINPHIPFRSAQEMIRVLAHIEDICFNCDSARGIWKRIDENRENFQLLQQNAGEVLELYPFIETWFGNMDIFLNSLLVALEWKPEPWMGQDKFPRPWIGDSTKSLAELYGHITPTTAIRLSASSAATFIGNDCAP